MTLYTPSPFHRDYPLAGNECLGTRRVVLASVRPSKPNICPIYGVGVLRIVDVRRVQTLEEFCDLARPVLQLAELRSPDRHRFLTHVLQPCRLLPA